MGLALLAILLLAYLGVVALAWAFQGRLIYPVPPVQSDIPFGFEEIAYLTGDGLELRAGYRRAENGRPTLLFFHGNGASWQSTAFVTDLLVEAGYGVLAAEYRGYGGNPGVPTEKGLYEDGRAAFAYLLDKGIAADSIVLVGNSIGSGIATQLATEADPLALVLISPFDSLEKTASRAMRWLPVRLLLRDRYANAAKFPTIGAPILILHGESDTLIPLAQAQALAAARRDVELVAYAGWGHDLVVHAPVQQRIAQFIQQQSR